MQLLHLAGWLPVVFASSGFVQIDLTVAEPSVTSEAHVFTEEVTEEQFLSALDEAHPAVIERSQGVAIARARVLDARLFDNPVFGIGREQPSGVETQTEWTVSWQLPGRSRSLEIEARQQELLSATASGEQELRSLRQEWRRAYAEWAVAFERAERLALQVARIDAMAERQRHRADKGEISGLEARRLKLAAHGLRTRLTLAESAAAETRSTVLGWSDLPATARPRLPSLQPMFEARAAGVAVNAEHPLLTAVRAELAAATLQRRAASRFVASPEVLVGWQQRQVAGLSNDDGALLGVSWSIPLFRRNQSSSIETEARQARARARAEGVETQIQAQRAGAISRYRSLVVAAGEALTVLGDNEAMLHAAQASFQYGETPLTDLLSIQQAVTESEMSWLDLHAAALAVHRQLEYLAGAQFPTSSTASSINPSHLEPQP